MTKDHTIIDYKIIWKKVNFSLTNEEEILLTQWLNESPLHQQYLDKAMRYALEGSGCPDNKAETDEVWNSLRNKGLNGNRISSRWFSSIAAAIAALIMMGTFLFPSKKPHVLPVGAKRIEIIKPGSNQAILTLNDGSVHDLTASKNLVLTEGGSEIKSAGAKLLYTESKNTSKEIMYNTLNIPRGGEFFLQLSDGTKVWLNSETILRYPVQFDGKERRVQLTGEAFFEVARNEKVPFLVESGEQIIKVLGTEFNISSYKEDKFISTTLVKGSVEVFIKNKPEIKQILRPNEQSLINKTGEEISKIKVDPYPFVAWKEGRFVFQDQNLGEIMKTLSKWYNIEVLFAHEELKNIRFTGNIERYSDFGKVLRKIQRTNEVNFTIENQQITIR